MYKKGKKKLAFRLLVLLLALVLAVPALRLPLLPGTTVYADELDDTKDKLDDTQDDIKDAEKRIKEGKAQAAALSSEIKVLEDKVTQTNGEISVLTDQLNTTKQKIATATAELNELEGKLNDQNTSLKSRLRAMYKTGEVGMFSVLFGSSSMSEMVTNYEMMQRIYKSDAQLIEDIGNRYEEVLVRKTELVELKKLLEEQQKDLNKKKTALNNDTRSVLALKKRVENNNAALEAQIDDLKKQADELKAQIKKLMSSGKYAGGKMCWPSAASVRITSPFGNRIHPKLGVYKFHTGIDIGAGHNTKILAANSGKVIAAVISRLNTGYGTYVVIDHGGQISTLYAHCETLLVKVGDKVKRGQPIALVGTTGMSTGYHLHFEVRISGQYQDPLKYVVPGKYYYD